MTSVDEVIRRQTTFDPSRLEPAPGEPTMLAVVTTGHGDLDKLEYREVRRPEPGGGEVLVRVLAAGVNTTEINTRVGWYEDGGWDAPTPFPFIQGTDCCGSVDGVGPGGDRSLLGQRVLVRPCMRPRGFGATENVWMGSDFDGAFAQFVKVPASEAFAVESALSDVELGAIPCAFGTAENMLHRARVSAGQHVVVTGASGGVGSAVVQLARLRGAEVTAVARASKTEHVLALGATRVVGRDEAITAALGERSVDVVVDNVSGPGLDGLLATLRPGGVYVSSGAIAGPTVGFDKRVFYLHDLTMIGCTAWDEPVFPALIARLERGDLRPRVAETYALERISDAQTAMLEKRHVGKLVLVPPGI